ncbi:acyclic terpene utilization AtuA family protein [Actibacterium sp. 188UL27-1]|uniref:acyclic terpene utilization AtuA family protein n=1 Tax=Actibacterium sp. 188UL27-1 TaxID=2786961 RepID=UPI001EF4CB04|nr:acyclic terpene utilization AtuA family protein [Actibacterium sp. 188UL27-1]
MVRVLVPSGALGLDYDKGALARGVTMQPDLIAIDGGSTDSGPSYLGRGVSKYSRASTKIEWQGLIAARATAGCPLVIGTAGTCGADQAVDWLVDLTKEILAELGQTAKIAILKSGQPPEGIVQALSNGRVTPLAGAPVVDAETIAACTNIVALAGAEQIQAALNTGADIIIAGRCTDTALIAALPLMRGCHPGAAWHGAKIGECGALCATRPQTGVILLDFDDTGFTVQPLAEGAKATPHTVSAHMLYENSDPFILHEPGGHLDVHGAEYVQLRDGAVRVTGARWVPSQTYTVKLEGARLSGYQTVALTLIRDAQYVTQADQWCADIIARCTAKALDRLDIAADDFTIELRQIGRNATLGPLEHRDHLPIELGVLAMVTAPTAALAEEIAKMLNPYLLHHPLTEEEEVPTFAFPFSPAEISRGAVYEFCLHHVMTLDDPMSAFRLNVLEMADAEAG